ALTAGSVLEQGNLGVDVADYRVDLVLDEVVLVGRRDGDLLDLRAVDVVRSDEGLVEDVGRASRVHPDGESLEVRDRGELDVVRGRAEAQRGDLVDGREGHNGYVLGPGRHEGGQVGEAEVCAASADEAQRVGRAATRVDRLDLDAFVGEVAELVGDEEH